MDDVSQPSLLYTTTPTSLTQEDIRLCPMYEAAGEDKFDFQLNYHCGEYFSISSLSDRDNGPSSKICFSLLTQQNIILLISSSFERV